MRRVTLSQFLVGQQRDKKLINADLRLLIETIARACKAISTRVNKGALADGLGVFSGATNVQGEVQKKLDVLSNEILLEANEDRKSTRLNSSHGYISYAVFCLK